ncbi:SAV1 isoform 5, partial [Pan troglodytes]
MLSRKKTKNEVSKPAEVQGKYVKKETSPLLRNASRCASCLQTLRVSLDCAASCANSGAEFLSPAAGCRLEKILCLHS